MKNRILFAVLFFAFGILIALLTQFVLPFCASENGMRCYDSKIADFILGILIALWSAVTFFIHREKIRASFFIFIAALNLLVAFIPSWIVGTCPKIHMPCHAIAAPILLVLGILFAAISLGNAIYLFNSRRKNEIIQK